MILKKVKITYYSDDIKATKEDIVNILKDFGIFELELVEDFTYSLLDYGQEKYLHNEVWACIFYLPNNRFLDKKLNQISLAVEKIIGDGIFDILVSDLDTDSYKDEWKKSFHTSKISENIVVNPSWIEYTPNDNEIVIEIDPSVAFGTGTHETSSLCINMLEKYKDNMENMLDIGCGSGILMLVARKLGIPSVTGIDIDPNCYEIVKDNFKKNNLDGYEVTIGNLVDKIDTKYDLVVSNILVDVLEKLLLDIKKVIKNDSILIFSGILTEKEYGFIEKAEKIGLSLIDKKYKNKWCGLVFKYKE